MSRMARHKSNGNTVDTDQTATSVVVTPSPATAFLGISTQLSAIVRNAKGQTLNRTVTWQSSASAIASVTSAGLLLGVALGSAVLTAIVYPEAVSAQVSVTTSAMTAPQAGTAFNAIGGPVLRALYVIGVGQTVVTDGTSPTGFYLTRWNNALNQADGLHMRVNAENSGKGMPCLADGTPAGMGGIDVPAGTSDPLVTGTAEDFTLSPAVVGSSAMQQFLNPRTKGLTMFGFGKIRNNTRILQIGSDGDPNQVFFAGDVLNQVPALANAGIGGLSQGQGSTPTFYARHVNVTSGQGNNTFGQTRVGRAFYRDDNVGTNINQLAANRRFAILPSGGWVPDTQTPQWCVGVCSGRMSGDHVKLLCDWAETQPWGATLWRDPRIQLRQYGDSYLPADTIDTNTLIYGDGALVPAIAASVALSDVARGGNTQGTFQYGFTYYAEDMDLTYTPAVYHRTGEWLNQGNTAACLQDNLLACQRLKSLGPKHHVQLFVMRNEDSATDTNGDRAWIAANAVALGYADSVSDFVANAVGWSVYQWNGGAPNKIAQFWKDSVSDSAQHPSALGQRYILGMHRVDFELMLGLDISNHTYKIDFPVQHVDLTAGVPTSTKTGTALSRSGAPLAKTVKYVSGNTAVATVNQNTGLITRVAAGQTYIEAFIDGELARGVLIVNSA